MTGGVQLVHPCPGCGERLEVGPVTAEQGKSRVLCKCGWSGPARDDPDEAIVAWNQRHASNTDLTQACDEARRIALKRNGDVMIGVMCGREDKAVWFARILASELRRARS